MGATLPFAVDRVRPSIIQIRLDTQAGEALVVGTGFIVHPEGYALTARHVTEGVTRALAQPGASLHAGLAMPSMDGPIHMTSSFELVDCEVVEEDQRHDLALLRLDPNPFTSGKPSGVTRTPEGGMTINGMYGLAQLDVGRPRDGAAIAVSGYPLSSATLITTSGVVASAWEVDIVEVQPEGAPEGFTMPDIRDSYIGDVAVNPGNSGGPVCLARRDLSSGFASHSV